MLSHTSPWGVPKIPWAQGVPRNDTWDLWRRWWEGLNDPNVSEGPGLWERLPPTENKNHNNKAISYTSLRMSGFLNAQEYPFRRCELGDMAIWVGRYLETLPRYSCGLGLASGIAKVWTCINSLVLAQMGQKKLHWYLEEIYMTMEWYFVSIKNIQRSYAILKLLGASNLGG